MNVRGDNYHYIYIQTPQRNETRNLYGRPRIEIILKVTQFQLFVNDDNVVEPFG